VPENARERALTRESRHGYNSWADRLVSADVMSTAAAIITAVVTVIAPSRTLKITLAIVTVGFVLLALAGRYLPVLLPAAGPKRHREWELGRLAREIENGPPGQEKPLRDFGDSRHLVDDVAARLAENERLCVVRLLGEEILEVPPGIADDAIPQEVRCQVIVGAISWQLEKAAGLNDGKGVAQDLRNAATYSHLASESLDMLRQRVTETLREWRLAGPREILRFVPLAEVRKEDLDSEAGRWLLGLFKGLDCTYGIFIDPDDAGLPLRSHEGDISYLDAQRFVSWTLRPWLPEAKFKEVFDTLCDVVGDRHISLDLLRVRCAVIVAAAELDEEREPLRRLTSPDLATSTPAGRRRAAALEVRWLVGRKAARIADVSGDVTEAFDRLAVTGRVTPEMFSELMRDLGLSDSGIEELRTWLSGEEFSQAGIIAAADGSISLGKPIYDAAIVEWLKHDQPAAYQDAQIAAERCFRKCLVLNRASVPDPGYADLVAPGYGGLHLYEIPSWWKSVHSWRGHVAEITSPEGRKDAGVGIVCLFLETWWWWGDQLRLGYIDEVIGLAKDILRERPEWIDALEDFDHGYEPSVLKRPDAGDRWVRVTRALDFIADELGLRQGDVPADPVLARIYICWCFFSGDVAQYHALDPGAADRWYGHAAQACGDDPHNKAMRAFASYQQADTWIPSDTDRSMQVIKETRLAETAVELRDLSLRTDIARMYGDIRWKSGDIGGAFDAYGRALLLAYVYQVSQESDTLPPSKYTSAFYGEVRTRFARRISEARGAQHDSDADAAIERIRALFGPYWEHAGAPAASRDDDPLAVLPPLPDGAVLETFESDYAKTARLMRTEKLADEIATAVDQPLR